MAKLIDCIGKSLLAPAYKTKLKAMANRMSDVEAVDALIADVATELDGMYSQLGLARAQKPQEETPVPAVLKKEDQTAPKTLEKKPWSPKVAKEQKKFLLEEIDKAIEDAPEMIEGYPTPELEADEKAAKLAGTKIPGQTPTAPEVVQELWDRYQIPTERPAQPGYLSLEGTQEGTVEAYVYTDNQRIILLRQAIGEAIFNARPKVTIEVPGDGTFEIQNSKEALEQFKEKAKKFPTSKPKSNTPSTKRDTPTAPAAIGKTNEEKIKAAALGVTKDEKRYVLTFLSSDGENVVGTNGRILIRIEGKFGGSKETPIILNQDGSKAKGDDAKLNFPSWRQVVPTEAKERLHGVDSARLFNLIVQAMQVTSDAGNSVKLWLNPDRSIGVTSQSENGEYEHNKQTGAIVIGAYNPRYLLDALNALRMAGNEKVSFLWNDDLAPLDITGKNGQVVLMPMRLTDEIGTLPEAPKGSFQTPDIQLARDVSNMGPEEINNLPGKVKLPQEVAEAIAKVLSEDEFSEVETYYENAQDEIRRFSDQMKGLSKAEMETAIEETLPALYAKSQFFGEILKNKDATEPGPKGWQMPGRERPDIWSMSDEDLAAYIRSRFGKPEMRKGTLGRPGLYTFPDYDSFAKYMDARYAERDLEGMTLAFKEAPDNQKIRYLRENRKESVAQHKRDWIGHIVTGSPLPAEDPPVERTTPRPTASGQPAPPPAAGPQPSPGRSTPPPPPPPQPPKSKPNPKVPQGPSRYTQFSTTALVQLLRMFKQQFLVRKLADAWGSYNPNTNILKLREKLLWDDKLAARVMAHEVGHWIDYALKHTSPFGTIRQRIDPLNIFRRQLASDTVLTKEAKQLSAIWRGPFSPSDAYRNRKDELFADFMSAMFNAPEWVNQNFPQLHNAFEYLRYSKKEFNAAYLHMEGLLRGDTIVDEVMKQQAEASDQSIETLLEEKEENSQTLWNWIKSALVTKYPNAFKIAGKPLALGGEMLDALENSSIWATAQNALMDDDFRKKVAPYLRNVSDNLKDALTLAHQYLLSARIIDERRTAGKWIENNPGPARRMLQTVLTAIPGLQQKFQSEFNRTPADGLYDFAAKLFLNIDALGEDYIKAATRAIDSLPFDVTGQNALMAFNVRGKLLNPGGVTPDVAQAEIDRLEKDLGQDRFDNLKKAAQGVRDILFDIQKQAYEEGLISEATWKELIEPNRGSYVPFAVMDYWDGTMRAGVLPQQGTSKDIANTVIAAQQKAAALNSWRQHQRQVALIMQAYAQGGQPVTPGKRLKNFQELETIRRQNKKDNVSRAIYYVDGQPHLVEFPGDNGKTWEKAIDSASLYDHMSWLTSAAGWTHGLMQFYTTMSLPFIFYRNPIRGFRTTYLKVGARGVLGVTVNLKTLWKSVRQGFNYAHAAFGGELDPQVRDFIEAQGLPSPRRSAVMVRDVDNLKELMAGGSVLAWELKRSMQKPPAWWKGGQALPNAIHAMERIFTAYEAFEKIQSYKAAMFSGKSEEQAIAIMQRSGIPRPGIGGHFSLPLEIFLPWTRVHVQGVRSTFDMLRDPELSGGFKARFLATEIAPRAAKYAIGAGVIAGAVLWRVRDDEDDEDPVMAEVFKRISPYKMALDDVIPLMLYNPRDGSYHMFNTFKSGSEIPRHFEVVSYRIPASEEGRLWGTLFYNMLVTTAPKGEELARPGQTPMYALGNWTKDYLAPGISPAIETTGDLYDMVALGKNPPNSYTGGPSVNETLFDAGGVARWEAIAGYVMNQGGGPGDIVAVIVANMGVLDPRSMNAVSKRIEADKTPITERLPLVKSMFSFDNYADYRGEKLGELEEEKIRANAKLIMSPDTRRLYEFYWRNRDKKDSLDDADLGRLQAASRFVNTVWGRLDDPDSFYSKTAAAVNGSPEAKETVRRDMDSAAAPWLAIFNNPMVAEFQVSLHGPKSTKTVNLPASEARAYQDILNRHTEEMEKAILESPKWPELEEKDQKRLMSQAREKARKQATAEFLRR